MNTPVAKFNVSDYTQVASTPGGMVVYVSGVTRRGPVNDPSQIIDTYEKFRRIFGDEASESLFSELDPQASKFTTFVKRMLRYGARLRINRVVHTAIEGEAATASAKAPYTKDVYLNFYKKVKGEDAEGNEKVEKELERMAKAFTATIKYPGADYNGIHLVIKPASNGNKKAFDMDIVWPANPDYSESYQNIAYPNPSLSASEQTYLDSVSKLSQLVDFEYVDIKDAFAPDEDGNEFEPDWDNAQIEIMANLTQKLFIKDSPFSGGSNGGAVTKSDFLKATQAFDQYQDGPVLLAVPGIYDVDIQNAFASYAVSRQDMVYMGSLHITSTDQINNAIEDRNLIAGDTPYVVITCGGIKILDPNTNKKICISEIADVIGLIVTTYNNRGAWFDPASRQSASILDAIGVEFNFGTPALSKSLNDLANHGINPVISDNGILEWKSSYTCQLTDSAMSFLSVVMLTLYMRATMLPVLKSHLKEPCDIVTFKAMYRQFKTFLDNLANTQNRALWKYEYMGDQDASSLDDLTVNRKEDVQIGKYKAFLKVWVIVPLVDATLNMMLVMGDGEVGIEIE